MRYQISQHLEDVRKRARRDFEGSLDFASSQSPKHSDIQRSVQNKKRSPLYCDGLR